MQTSSIKRAALVCADDPADGTSWYLINCVAGVELDLLNQCRQVCEHFPKTDVEKFVVPTTRHLRSHGDKKKVVDVRVRYPGYVFCKIRLVEDVYETLQELDLARSWMGTVNRKGHKKLPPAPLPLGPEEVKRFKGLEEAQEVFEDMFGGDYTGRTDTGADLYEQYAGYDVGQMVKVLRGNFEGEDGTVRRLKDGQLMVRMFTYGQTYDEWFDPDAVRPLTDLEVMRGLSGPTKPVDQDQFDVSIGKKDPSILEGREMTDDASPSLRSSLMQSAGAGPGRNRREDRVARGETGRDIFGRTAEEQKREEQNWLAYREQQRASQRGEGSSYLDSMPTESKRKKEAGPKKGHDTWCVVLGGRCKAGSYLIIVSHNYSVPLLPAPQNTGELSNVARGAAASTASRPIPRRRSGIASAALPPGTSRTAARPGERAAIAVEGAGTTMAVASVAARTTGVSRGTAVRSGSPARAATMTMTIGRRSRRPEPAPAPARRTTSSTR